MKNNNIETQTMTEKEIKDILLLLKKAIKENKIAYTRANPLEQNCYISSSDIIGVYFPNTIFVKCLAADTLQENKCYRLCALAKVNNKLGVCLALLDDIDNKLKDILRPYKFIDFDTFLFGHHYCSIKQGIINDIRFYNSYIEKLERVKRTYKKDGSDFKDACKNFVGGLGVSLHFDFLGRYCNSICVNGCQIYRDNQTENLPTVEEIEQLIKMEIERYKEFVKDSEKEVANLPQLYRKFERAAKEMKTFRESVKHWIYYAKELDYML